jgi:hypothetical protein
MAGIFDDLINEINSGEGEDGTAEQPQAGGDRPLYTYSEDFKKRYGDKNKTEN